MDSRYADLPPLSTLRAFEAAGRHQNFTKAADELCLTQSAISRHVRTLESHLGVKLFEREHRVVRLTADGQTLMDAVAMSLGHISAKAREIRQQPSVGRLTVGMISSFASLFMVRRIGEFMRNYPDLDVHMVSLERNPNPSVDSFDVTIAVQPHIETGFESWPLFTEEIYPICSPEYLEGHQPMGKPAELVNQSLLHLDDAFWTGWPWSARTNWRSWLSEFGIELPSRPHGLIFSSYQMVVQAAMRGHGIGMGWHHLVAEYVREGSLVRPIPHTCRFDRGHYMVVASAIVQRPEVKTFCAWLRTEVEHAIAPA